MTLSILVTNQLPAIDRNVSLPLLDMFQAYTRAKTGQAHYPFEHQAQTFREVEQDHEALLVAGTAAGKTLAIAVPLFHKLQTGRIHKILLMYPTIALMEDQRQVMDKLAEITGLEVGQIQGGMSRSQLMAALNKPVILATPDAVYWFFRKNIKYNGLLIYGLAQVNEFVLDEAHLFNGLMLRNFEHLWQRIKVLANNLGKSPRLHILTATPTESLRRLNNAQEIKGKSKCDDVQVEFQLSGRFERDDDIAATVNQVLAAGQRKVLVVCNSARMAHQLFLHYKVNDTSTIPVEHRFKFGKVALGALLQWLEQTGVEKEIIEALNERFFREEDVTLDDVPSGIRLQLSLQDVVAHTGEILERQCWRIKRALWEQSQRTGETLESLLPNYPLMRGIAAVLRERLQAETDAARRQSLVDDWLSDTTERLSNISQDPIPCEATEFAALTKAFMSVGVPQELASLLTRRVKFDMKAEPDKLPTRNLSDRRIYLRWLDWAVDQDKVSIVHQAVKQGIESGELKVECQHVGLWKGADVPVIVYSGSMSKQARAGLIDVFAGLDSAVLISTSAVEVGVDFHADALITEECEGNSFLQRFGRVGRHGQGSKVILLTGGEAYSKLTDLDGATLAREVFSEKIVEVFPPRSYVSGSEMLDASHYLVNWQLGRIGERLNETIPGLAEVKPFAEQLRSAKIQTSFGLRGTLPQITLRDGVTKDPFYLLRYVDDQALRPADSPFEVARAKTWFTNLIFQKARFEVIVDLGETLKASQHLILLNRGQPLVSSGMGIGERHLVNLMQHNVKIQALYFLLLHGDVYLSWVDRETQQLEPVKDREQNPLFIPNQTYLVLWGWRTEEDARTLLQGAGAANWEELYYDWDGVKQDTSKAMVILEKVTGACFAAYKELVYNANRQVQ